MSQSLRAGVIGLGVFGGFHAAKYASLEGVRLAGIYDHNPAHAAAASERLGVPAFPSEAALIAEVDLVSVATPAVAHADAALKALRAGKPVYVEKPLAARRADAELIVAEADRRGLVVACGFLERAGFAAMGLFDIPERPLRLEAVRVGPPSPRNLDVSVVLDLMIHDLDLALALGAGERGALSVTGSGGGRGLDEADAVVEFENGFVCRFHASRNAADRERTMRIVYPSGAVTIDFLVHRFENTTPFALDPEFESTPAGRDRLGVSIGAFVAAVRGEGPAPLASAREGAAALDLALAVEEAAAVRT
ncbi:MAG: Gfo/Idh/MocA family oxidoreductase [Caulobacteraceae bacterium]|nr:Gfo/Idh/MocA family oxidoreductase [Caulobacteraceae bacterium]